MFYLLEANALSSTIANRPFIVTPPTIPKDVQSPEDLRGLACVELTYKQVYDTVLQFAAWLKKEHGVKKGDIVALDFTNKPQFIFIWFALWSLGARPAFINTGLREEALLHCVKASTANLLIIDPDLQEALIPEVQSGLDSAGVITVVVDSTAEAGIGANAGYRAPDEDRAGSKISDLAVLIFTSGTTGLPKPAIVPWKKFYTSSKTVSSWLSVKPTDRYYTVSKALHIAHLGNILTQSGNASLSQLSYHPWFKRCPTCRRRFHHLAPLLTTHILCFGDREQGNHDAIYRRNVPISGIHASIAIRSLTQYSACLW